MIRYLLLFCLLSQVAVGQELTDSAYIQLNYTKYEYQISMRDGIKLFTAVYVPKDAANKS